MSIKQAQNQVNAIRRSIRAKELIELVHSYCLDGADIEPQRVEKGLKALEFAVPKLKAVDHTTDGDKIDMFAWDK